MPDALSRFTDFVLTPGKPVAAGFAICLAVWGFFRAVETVLNDEAKVEIWWWLAGIDIGQVVEPWQDSFAKVFDRVFGERHLSWKCLWRSYLMTICVFLFCGAIYLLQLKTHGSKANDYHLAFAVARYSVPILLLYNGVADYLSLLKTRFLIGHLSRLPVIAALTVTLLDVSVTLVAAAYVFIIGYFQFANAVQTGTATSPISFSLALITGFPMLLKDLAATIRMEGFVKVTSEFLSVAVGQSFGYLYVSFYPIFFAPIWFWVYASSGFAVIVGRRFGIGYKWFTRHFDIERHPLSSMGFLSGCILTLAYWTWVVVSKVI